MSETLTQHVVLSDVEYDRLTARLALAEAVVAAARAHVHVPGEASFREANDIWIELVNALDAYDRAAAQEREGNDG